MVHVIAEKDGPTAVDGSAGFGSVTSMSKEVFTAIGASTTGAIAIAEPEKNDVWAVAAVITAKLIGTVPSPCSSPCA